MTKISNLPSDSSPTTTDLVPTVDVETNTTKKSTLANLIALFFNNVPAGSIQTAGLDDGAVIPVKQANPYKFSAYHNTTQNSGSGAFAQLSFNTELFDTNNNFASNQYTVPVSGFYLIEGRIHTTDAPTRLIISIFKNGTEIARGGDFASSGGGTNGAGVNVSKLLQLSATDVITLRCFGNTTLTIASATDGDNNYFTGHLVSIT